MLIGAYTKIINKSHLFERDINIDCVLITLIGHEY